MSLIYTALNRLEKKSTDGTPVQMGSIGADQYVLASAKPGMPAWVKWMLALFVFCIIAGWFATTTLRDQIINLQAHLAKSSASATAAVPAVAETTKPLSAVLSPVVVDAVPAAVAVAAPVPASDEVSAAKIEDAKEKLASAASLIEKKEQEQKAKAEAEATANAVAAEQQAIPETQISHVEIKVESVNGVDVARAPKTNSGANSKAQNAKLAKLEKAERAAAAKEMAAPASATLTTKTRNEDSHAQEVAKLTAGIKSAIQAGNKDEADRLLRQLQTQLDPESLTLLHLQAWRQMRLGDSNQAMSLYQQIVGRNPDDETAAVNLSLLYWKSGQQAEAKRTIEAIAERHPESEVVQSYSRQFGVQK